MITKQLNFYSNTYRLSGNLYLPDNIKNGDKLPCLVACSGYMGLNVIYPALFARGMTLKGYAVFGFDYRGFLDNEGSAGVCKLEEQVEDIRNAVAFCTTLSEVKKDSIGVIAWAMAAGLAAKAASYRNGIISAVAGLNGFYCGERWMRQVFSYTDFIKMKTEITDERIRMAKEGTRKYSNPFHFYPLDSDTDYVVKANLYTVNGYGQEISLELGESLMDFDAEETAWKINVPFFVGHGKYNLLHPINESEEFFKALNCPKTFYYIEGKHNDFMFDGHPVFNQLLDELDKFFRFLF